MSLNSYWYSNRKFEAPSSPTHWLAVDEPEKGDGLFIDACMLSQSEFVELLRDTKFLHDASDIYARAWRPTCRLCLYRLSKAAVFK